MCEFTQTLGSRGGMSWVPRNLLGCYHTGSVITLDRRCQCCACAHIYNIYQVQVRVQVQELWWYTYYSTTINTVVAGRRIRHGGKNINTTYYSCCILYYNSNPKTPTRTNASHADCTLHTALLVPVGACLFVCLSVCSIDSFIKYDYLRFRGALLLSEILPR